MNVTVTKIMIGLFALVYSGSTRADAEFLKTALPKYIEGPLHFVHDDTRKAALIEQFKDADKLWDSDRNSFIARLPNDLIYAGLNFAMTPEELKEHLKTLFAEYRREGKLFSRDEWLKCVHPTEEHLSSPARNNPMQVYVSKKNETKWIEKAGDNSIYRFLASEWINSWNEPKLKAPKKIMVVRDLSDFSITVYEKPRFRPSVRSGNVDIFAEKIEGGEFAAALLRGWSSKLSYNDASSVFNPTNNMINKDGVQYIIDLESHAVEVRGQRGSDSEPFTNYARMRTALKLPEKLHFDFAHIPAPVDCGLNKTGHEKAH